jgi:hypothetical protein
MNKQVSLKEESISRRHFARDIVATTAVALMPAGAVVAEKKATVALVELGPAPEGISAADWDEVHVKYLNILRVYGNRISLDEKRSLVNILTTNQHMLISIRSFAVQNGDASACTLRVTNPKNS